MPANIESRHEIPVSRRVADVRPASQRFAEFLSNPWQLAGVLAASMCVVVVFPLMGVGLLPFMLGCIFAHVVTKQVLPLRYPLGTADERGKPGQGIMYVGHVDSDSPYEAFKQIYLSDDDLRKHILIIGGTGSGKSEALKAVFYNALSWSSGFFIADGKADNKLPTDVFAMVRSFGRDADMLVLNFLLGGKTPQQVGRARRRRSNGINPFSSADADTIIQMGANLLPKVEGDGKNWQEKALNLWRALVAAVCYKRDTQGLTISVSTFLEYMALSKIEDLYVEGYIEALERGSWSYGFAAIKNYLDSGCPGYSVDKLLRKRNLVTSDGAAPANKNGRGVKEGREFEQDVTASEQHAYRTTQLIPVLNLLDKTYGYIFSRRFPEIEMTDVTLRNRILVMLIPSLEKSASEAENLGKLAIACLRVMMSKNLGSELEGDHEELLGAKATNSPCPYVVALDELAYYFSDGIAVMFAQARSLGISMIAAAQDLEKLTEGSRAAEAGAMFANQTVKFFLRINDANKTAEMISKVLGKTWVAVKESFDFGDMGYRRGTDVKVMDADRATASQLQAFEPGQGIVNAAGRTTFMRWFYMGEDIEKHRPPQYLVNRYLQVSPPSETDVAAASVPAHSAGDPYLKGLELLRQLRQESVVDMRVPFNPVVGAIARAAAGIGTNVSAEERGILLYQAAARAVADDPAQALAAAGEHIQEKPAAAMGHAPVAKQAQTDDRDEDDDDDSLGVEGDPLMFLRPSPFQRKPAEEVLGITGRLSPAEAMAALIRPEIEQGLAAMGPLDSPAPPALRAAPQPAGSDAFAALVRKGASFDFATDIKLAGPTLARLIGAPNNLMDPATGLAHTPPTDWISAAVEASALQAALPPSSDDTVVGLNALTMAAVERVEELMDSPNPALGAQALERVVSVRTTPNTKPGTDSTDGMEDVFANFHRTLQRG